MCKWTYRELKQCELPTKETLISISLPHSHNQQMDSSAISSQQQHANVVLKQCDTLFPSGKNPSSSSRRSPSFSSSSSSFSPSSSSTESLYFNDDTLVSPASPLRFSGVPFSWEHLPGIPKKQNSKKQQQESSMKLLPLMPPPTSTSTNTSSKKPSSHEETRVRKKNVIQSSFQRDPFFAALVECSKDDQEVTTSSSSTFWGGPKVSRSISDRFGFTGLYASCKRTCAVSESIVYLPSSRRSNYEHVSRRSL